MKRCAQTWDRLRLVSWEFLKDEHYPTLIPKNVIIIPKNVIIIIGSAEALPILCVRCARWEREREIQRERERERERERDGSDVTLVALKLAMNFAPFLGKNFHLSIGEEFCTFPCQKFAPLFLPSWRALSSHFPLPKTLRSSFCFCQMASQGIEAPKQAIEFPAAPSFFSNQTSFFFYPTNVNWQLDQTRKKTQRSPAGDRTRVFRLPVGRSNHWATKPRQELRANFCLSPNCQFFFTTRWPECLSLQTRRDQRNSLDLNVIVQIEIRSCRDHSI